MYFLRCKLRLGGLIKCHYICSSTFHKLLRLVFLFYGFIRRILYKREKLIAAVAVGARAFLAD